MVAVGDCLTSIFGGFVIFSILGYMSKVMDMPIDDVVEGGI